MPIVAPAVARDFLDDALVATEEAMAEIQNANPKIKLSSERMALYEAYVKNHKDTVGFNATEGPRVMSGKTKTIERYASSLKGCFAFCVATGRYQTALYIDAYRCPADPLPFIPEDILAYALYKSNDRNQNITLPEKPGAQPLKNVEGHIITSTAEWKAPTNIDHLRAALRALVKYYGQDQQYQAACPRCAAANPGSLNRDGQGQSDWRSCSQHAGQPKLLPSGNPLTESYFLKQVTELKERLAKKHKVRGNLAILPAQLRRIRKHLINSGSLEGLQTYCMMILGVKLFLRADELIKIRICDFKKEYATIHPNSIKSLCIGIQGKTDEEEVTLMIYRDDKNPEFCALRHLLVYVKKARITSGCLFPSWPKLKKAVQRSETAPVSFADNDHVTYDDWLKRMKAVVGTVFTEAEKKEFTIGTHTLRKTAYLFACWGIMVIVKLDRDGSGNLQMPAAVLVNLLLSARHRSVSSSATYIADTGALFEMSQIERFQHEQRVSRWQSIFVRATPLARNVTQPSSPYQAELPALADFFFDRELLLPDDSSTLYATALEISMRETEESDPMAKILAMLAPESRTQAKALLEEMCRNAVQSRDNLVSAASAAHVSPDRAFASDLAAAPSSAKRRRAECAVVSLKEHRERAGTYANQGQVKKFLMLMQEVDGLSVDEKDRKWRMRARNVVKRLQGCVDGCFNGKLEDFCASNPNFGVAKYKCTCNQSNE